MSKVKKFSIRGAIIGAAIAVTGLVGNFVLGNKPIVASSARDCEANSIMWCGAMTVDELVTKYDNRGDAQHRYNDIPAVYNHFGISGEDVHSLKSKASLGKVRADGTVWLNGQLIGQNALTAGRHNKPGSTPIAGTGAFARPPRVSFSNPDTTIDAFIGYENGKPAWAILSSCANPVKWDRPNLEIEKKIGTPDGKQWVEEAEYINNNQVGWLITVTNTGRATDSNVVLHDFMPKEHSYVRGSTQVNGRRAGDGIVTIPGLNIGSLAPGQKVQVTFRTKVEVPETKCGLNEMTNLAHVNSDKSSPKTDTAKNKVRVTCITRCDRLYADRYEVKVGETLKFTAKATAQGTRISEYVFKVNGEIRQSGRSDTFEHKFVNPGEKTVTVLVKFANGKTAGETGNCVKKVNVKEHEPIIKCDELTAPKYEVKAGEELVFTAKGTAQHATINTYEFRVNGQVVQNTDSNKYKFKQTQDGEYTVKVTIKTNKGDATSAACEKAVKVKTPFIIRCDSLTAAKYTVKPNEEIVFTAKGTVENAKINTYEFRVNGQVVQNTASNKYTFKQANPGNYVVLVTLKTDRGDASSNECEKTVKVEELPVVIRCDSLTASKTTVKPNEEIEFVTKASVENAIIQSYEYQVNGKVVQDTASDKYIFKQAKDGAYQVVVTVKTNKGKATSPACEKIVNVETPELPVYRCDSLGLSASSINKGNEVTATVNFTAKQGASFKQAIVNFGDGSDKVTVTEATDGKFSLKHTYNKVGNFDVTAQLDFMVDGKLVSISGAPCAAKINVGDVLPVVTIPKTGPANVLGMFAGVTVLAASAHSLVLRRKL
jgi:uncharacterized repeat protein (TIGR01451 family)